MPDHIPDTGKMLARFAAAFAKVAERWPDAPWLPEHYGFDENIRGLAYMFCVADYVPPAAALALCTVTAMRIAGQWEYGSPGRRFSIKRVRNGWWVNVASPEIPWPPKDGWPVYADEALAYLAALEAIVGHER